MTSRTQRRPDCNNGPPNLTAAQFQKLRVGAGLSTVALSLKLGIVQRQVQYYESGKVQADYLTSYAMRHL